MDGNIVVEKSRRRINEPIFTKDAYSAINPNQIQEFFSGCRFREFMT